MRHPTGGLGQGTLERDTLPRAAGLSEAEARRRLAVDGPNVLPSKPRERLWAAIARQFRDPMGLLLLLAAAITGSVLNEWLEAGVIALIVAINGWIAVTEERKAEAAIAGLERFQVSEVKVVRGGVRRIVPATELVAGDLVVMGAGDRVPADCTFIEANDVHVDESMLSGESLPADKAPGDRGFLGTVLQRGSARALVEATGPRTRLGSIVAMVEATPPKTPLQVEFGSVTARLGLAAIAVAVIAGALTVPRLGLERAVLAGVALAVAAVPEGLTSIVTIALALGARRMADRGSVVRRLSAVETLGCTDVLLTDKTGTLTINQMKVTHAWVPGGDVARVADLGPEPSDPARRILVLCNEASLDPPVGDPMEVALLEWAGGASVRRLRSAGAPVDVVPFDATNKRMSSLYEIDGERYVLVKGAPEVVIPMCSGALTGDGEVEALDREARGRAEEAALRLAREGARVLCLAERRVGGGTTDVAGNEGDLTLIGLVGLADPIRPEAVGAVTSIRGAGIDVIMVTGDHPSTAASIGREVGIEDDGQVRHIYARVQPEEKLNLVRAFRDAGHVVAVTGDGVNDAPALRHADIGVAMGRSGTDAAREAADMVVTDDNLATIAVAIREGRGIYDNVRKVVEYLVASNLTEVAVVIFALVAFPALGVPLLPLQLLWINLLTDALPAVALGLDPIDESVMNRSPRVRGERLLGAALLRRLSIRACVMAAGSLAALVVAVYLWDGSWHRGRASMFLTLAASQLVYAFVVRSRDRACRPAPNRSLVLAVALSSMLLVGITLTEDLRDIFGTVVLTPREWALVLVCSLVPGAAIWLGGRWRTRASSAE